MVLGKRQGGCFLLGSAPPDFRTLRVRGGAMAKQRSTQSRGPGEAGAKITSGQGLERILEPLVLVLDEQALGALAAASDALGRILSTESIGAQQVSALAGAEDVLDQIERALTPACEAIKASLASR